MITVAVWAAEGISAIGALVCGGAVELAVVADALFALVLGEPGFPVGQMLTRHVAPVHVICK